MLKKQNGIEIKSENYKEIAKYYGLKMQLIQLNEELAELIQAASKMLRFLEKAKGLRSTKEEIYIMMTEEIADVELMLKQIIYLLNVGKNVDKRLQEKINRTLKNIRS